MNKVQRENCEKIFSDFVKKFNPMALSQRL